MKRLIPLFGVFLALVVVMAWRETKRPQSGSAGAAQVLTPVAPQPFGAGDVTSIQIAPPGGADGGAGAFALERRGEGDWIVTAPFRAPASAGRAATLVRAVANCAGELRSADAATHAAFDLTPERAVGVTVLGEDGTLARLLLGRSSGPQGAFVRILDTADADASAVFAVASPLRSALGLEATPAGAHEPAVPDPSFFHDAEFPALDLRAALTVRRTSPRNDVAFTKRDDLWVPDGGGTLPPKPGGVTNTLHALAAGLKTVGLADPAVVRGKEPTHRLVVSLSGVRRTVLGWATPGAFHARLDVERDPDVVYVLEPGSWAAAFPPGAALFEMGRLEVRTKDLGRMVIERKGGPTLDMSREDGHPKNNWVLLEPQWPLPSRQQDLRALPVTLGFVRPIDWVDGLTPESLARRETPDVVIRFGKDTDADDALGTLLVYGAAPGGVGGEERLAVMPDVAQVVVITRAMLDRVAPDLIELFHREIFRGIDADFVAGIDVETRAETHGGTDGAWTPRFALDKRDETWTLRSGGEEGAADGNGVEAWMRRVLALRADAVVDSGSVAAVVRITLRLHAGAPWVLECSDAVEGRRLVRRGGAAFATDGLGRIPDADAFRVR